MYHIFMYGLCKFVQNYQNRISFFFGCMGTSNSNSRFFNYNNGIYINAYEFVLNFVSVRTVDSVDIM
jgi:hypothetical protein